MLTSLYAKLSNLYPAIWARLAIIIIISFYTLYKLSNLIVQLNVLKMKIAMKRAIVLGGGGFIGGHLGKSLKSQGYHVRMADIKYHEYFDQGEICDEFIKCDS